MPPFAVDLLPAGWYGGAISLAAASRWETPGRNEDGGGFMDHKITQGAAAERLADRRLEHPVIRVAGVIE
jgi:hypothetical protein